MVMHKHLNNHLYYIREKCVGLFLVYKQLNQVFVQYKLAQMLQHKSFWLSNFQESCVLKSNYHIDHSKLKNSDFMDPLQVSKIL